MADPLSIAAGVVGIVVPALHGTRILIDDVKRIVDAPEAIRVLRKDLNSTALALESLQTIPESEWESLGSTVAEQSKDTVKTCGSACDTFRNDLHRWTRRSRGGELAWRDRANVGFFEEKYASLRTSHMTEELKNTLATSRNDLSGVARRNDDEIALVRQTLAELTVDDTTLVDDAEEDDRISVEAQLSEQKAAPEMSQALFAQLQSLLQDEKIERLVVGRGGNANVSFGSITGGFGIGVTMLPSVM